MELFRLDDAVAYRVGYACIRQLALLLRSASVAKPKGESKEKAKGTSKVKKGLKKEEKAAKATDGKKKAKATAETLMTWSFVRSIFLWTRLVGDSKALKDLAYPLYMVILGSVKSGSSINSAPFCLHGLRALNELMQKTQKLVPLSALLLRQLDMNLKALEKAPKGRN